MSKSKDRDKALKAPEPVAADENKAEAAPETDAASCAACGSATPSYFVGKTERCAVCFQPK